jgi:hypothetical protein
MITSDTLQCDRCGDYFPHLQECKSCGLGLCEDCFGINSNWECCEQCEDDDGVHYD